MSTARSAFTEAIEDHLALKKQNAYLETNMPIARYDVGDPLDRYPGGHGAAAGSADTMVIADDVDSYGAVAGEAGFMTTPGAPAQAASPVVGPSPEQAMEAATSLEPAFADQPFEPLGGMTPMLSLVEDIDDEDEPSSTETSGPIPVAAAPTHAPADVLRFPGGVGPRVGEPASASTALTGEHPRISVDETGSIDVTRSHAPVASPTAAHEIPGVELDSLSSEQSVLVIDAEEPLAAEWAEPAAPVRSSGRRKPRFFGLGRKKSDQAAETDGWFTDGPRDFNWD